jgi:hypothetical protein
VKFYVSSIAFLLMGIGSAWADPVENCSKALVPTTTNVTYDEVTTFALAYSLSESAWDDARQKFGVNAVVYGVPIGADWSSYHATAKQKAESLNINYFDKYAYAYATSGLSGEALGAYTDCIVKNYGAAVYSGQSGTKFYTVYISYKPPIDVKPHLKVAVYSKNIEKESAKKLEEEVKNSDAKAGRQVYLPLSLEPEDANQESTVDFKVGNAGATLLLPPLHALQKKPPEPPTPESIRNKLIGEYQVILGPKGGCNGGAPNSRPAAPARITYDGRDPIATNECGDGSRIRISIDGKTIYFYGESAKVDINGEKVVLTDDRQNK